ncbi:Transcriptional regulator HosA [Sulfitobacter sp. DSM 110093]|uniref:MarR family winged helix-turn-helix transcriptional regulator n=1 Tax=Sulfitobacter sp. DSM 110093 TaxID=2883127 RepID=UPI001FAC4A82|nr:MarR family transcriptional regulator [Sulfitobacter sp. DSM 110093]UOA33301.1 Transcriptional regulator HosA [Sulfitobacter sp. DSM 110093]
MTNEPEEIEGRLKLEEVYCAPGYLIRRLQQVSSAIFLDELSQWKVTPIQYAALVAIRETPRLDQSALSSVVAADRSTIGTMLRSLEGRGLVVREVPKNNKRIKTLRICPEGERLLDETRAAISEVENRLLSPFSPDERVVFIEMLTRAVSAHNETSRAPLRPSKTNAK